MNRAVIVVSRVKQSEITSTDIFAVKFTTSSANDEWNYSRLVIVPARATIVQLQLTVKTSSNLLVVMFL